MRLAVIIPVYNASRLLAETLESIRSGSRVPDELIVVDDASRDDSASVAAQFGARVLRMQQNVGPATCRNCAALVAESPLLVFLDADTCVHPDTLLRLEAHFVRDPELGAVIGAYDDKPRDPGLCSQYRNLAHCYVHRHANRGALTFWSGCGAVRKQVFLDIGGFDEHFRRSSIEDIEFGYRMSDHGVPILLDPETCVTHTKRWTLSNGIVTDVVNRGAPWMALLLYRKQMPDDLNTRTRHRIAVGLTGAALLCIPLSVVSAAWLVPCASFLVASAALDAGLIRFLYGRGGRRLAAAAVPMTLLQNACKLAGFVGGSLIYALGLHPSGARNRNLRSRVLDGRKPVRQQLVPSSGTESEP